MQDAEPAEEADHRDVLSQAADVKTACNGLDVFLVGLGIADDHLQDPMPLSCHL